MAKGNDLTEGRWADDRPNPVGENIRSVFERERDLEIITRLYLHRKYQYEIPALLQAETGAAYRLSRQQITYDLEEMRRRWAESSIINFNEKLMEEVDKCNALEALAYESFFLSRKPKRVSMAKTVQMAMEQENANRVRQRIREIPLREETTAREEHVEAGNPTWILAIDRIARRRCELLRLIDVRHQPGERPGEGADEAALAGVDISMEERARRASVLLLHAVRRRDGLEDIPDESLASQEKQ